MKTLVCISNVPDTTTKITFTDNNTQFNTNGVQFILNPYDEIALARAIELTDGSNGTVTVINVGDAATEPALRKALKRRSLTRKLRARVAARRLHRLRKDWAAQ